MVFFIPIFKLRRHKEVIKLKIKVTHDFKDVEEDLRLRKKGEVYETSEERGKYLIDFKVAKQVKEKKGGDPQSPDKMPD